MTEPEQPTVDAPEPEQPIPPVAIPPTVEAVSAVVIGPGGKPMVALQLHYGFSQHTMVMTHETAAQLGAVISEVVGPQVDAARRAAAGLIVAGPQDLKGLVLPPNGR